MEDSRKFMDNYANFKKKDFDSSQTLDTYMEEGNEISLST